MKNTLAATPAETGDTLRPTEPAYGSAPRTVMQKMASVSKDGLREYEEEVPSPEAQAEAAELQAIATETGADVPTAGIDEVGSIDDLLKEYKGDDDIVVHPVVLNGTRFYIRELDMMSLIDVETQRLSTEKGQVVRKPNREAKLGLALEFSATIYRKTGDNPAKYEPVFTLETVQNFLKKPKAIPLIGDLAAAIYAVNPALNPVKKIQAANQ